MQHTSTRRETDDMTTIILCTTEWNAHCNSSWNRLMMFEQGHTMTATYQERLLNTMHLRYPPRVTPTSMSDDAVTGLSMKEKNAR